MKKLYYFSTSYSDHYPDNTRSKFKAHLYESCLDYLLPSGGGGGGVPIEACIQSVIFSNKRTRPQEVAQVLAVKSTISRPTISSGGWDTLHCFFTVDHRLDGKLVDITLDNPQYFPTTKQRLANAEFEIVNLADHQQPDFAVGSPTFIIVAVRPAPHLLDNSMKQPFQLMLDSSCPISLQHYPDNTNMDFAIQLPTMFNFSREWSVALKSLSYTNRFKTIHRCSVTINDEPPIVMLDSFISSLDYYLGALNQKMAGRLTFVKAKSVSKIRIAIGRLDLTVETIELSSNLANILGFATTTPRFNTNGKAYGSYQPNIVALYPENLIVCCDLVEHSMLGSEQVQVLRYVSNAHQEESSAEETTSINFLHQDFVRLDKKVFDTIRIKVMDVSGHTVQCSPQTPTRLQLLFVNKTT